MAYRLLGDIVRTNLDFMSIRQLGAHYPDIRGMRIDKN